MKNSNDKLISLYDHGPKYPEAVGTSCESPEPKLVDFMDQVEIQNRAEKGV